MNENKICFITLVSDKTKYENCLNYIRSLIIPEGMTAEVRYIQGAGSMASGYQSAMEQSDAKYKIYLHQDVWIIQRDFLVKLIEIFKRDPKIGIAGVVGTKTLPPTGVWWEGEMVGAILDSHTGLIHADVYQERMEKPVPVMLLDGLLLATQYDIPWRKDVFDKWHFYDSSQCMEFRKRGYKAVVLPQNYPWCVHWCGINAMRGYDEERGKFLSEYLPLPKATLAVVIPRDAEEDALRRTLESVMNQTYRPVEILFFNRMTHPLAVENTSGNLRQYHLPSANENDFWKVLWEECSTSRFLSVVTVGTFFENNHVAELMEMMSRNPKAAVAVSQVVFLDRDGKEAEKQPRLLTKTEGECIFAGSYFRSHVLTTGFRCFGGLSAMLIDCSKISLASLPKPDRRYSLPYDTEIFLMLPSKGDVLYNKEQRFSQLPQERFWSWTALYHFRDKEIVEFSVAWGLAFLNMTMEGILAGENVQEIASGWLERTELLQDAEKTDLMGREDLLTLRQGMTALQKGQGFSCKVMNFTPREYFAHYAKELCITEERKKRLQAEWNRPWALVKRKVSLGDCICAEPIIRKLHKMGFMVLVATDASFIYDYNRDLTAVFPWDQVPEFILNRSLLVDLDEAYVDTRWETIIDAYIRTTQIVIPQFQLEDTEKLPCYDENLVASPQKNVKTVSFGIEARDSKRMCSADSMRAFLTQLKERGIHIVEIGTSEESYLGVGEKCFGRTFREVAEVMSKTDVFIGMDSGLFHLAQSMKLPVFVFFGIIIPNLRVHDWSRARVMWKSLENLFCIGCACRFRYTKDGKPLICHGDCLEWTTEELLDAFFHSPYNNPPIITKANFNPIVLSKIVYQGKQHSPYENTL